MSLFTPYRYSLRNSEQFRVVRVSAGRWQDPIRCQLIKRKFDGASEKHPYRALSYVWGSSSVSDTIDLEGFQFQITLNLSSALRHLRKVDEDTFLWVDALVSIASHHGLSSPVRWFVVLPADVCVVHQPTRLQGAKSPSQYHAIDIQEC